VLTNEPVINIRYINRETKTDEIFYIAQHNEDDKIKLTIEAFGTIIGCAVYFKEIEDAHERIVATNYHYCTHDNIAQYLLFKEGFRIFHIQNTENVRRGYITNNGFFLDEKLSMRSYYGFCKKNNIQLPSDPLDILYSSRVNWFAIQHKLSFLTNINPVLIKKETTC
jgi:hypothetical protein